jgi:hypothetical protein
MPLRKALTTIWQYLSGQSARRDAATRRTGRMGWGCSVTPRVEPLEERVHPAVVGNALRLPVREAPAALHAQAKAAPKVRASLVAIDFTSGVEPIYQNTANYDYYPNQTDPYTAVEWQRNPQTGGALGNAPVVQPLVNWPYHNVHAVVSLQILGVPNGTPYLLVGRSSLGALNFNQPGKVAVNPASKVGTTVVTGRTPLPNSIGVETATINWTLTIRPHTRRAKVIHLGVTGPHTIYETYGPPVNAHDPYQFPSNIVTDARLLRALQWASTAVSEAGGLSADPRNIVQHLLNDINNHIGFDPTRSLAGTGQFWVAPENGPLDCISLTTFGSWVAEMVGLPGAISVATYVPSIFDGTNYQWDTAIQGSLARAQTLPAGADPNHYRPVYYNGNTSQRLYLVDGSGNPNVFEAAAVYTYGGDVRIYPGGQSDTFLTPATINDILKVFLGVGYYTPGQAHIVHFYGTPPS